MFKPLNHLAIIMDGNGRWATARGLQRSEGHKAGAQNLLKVLELVKKKGIHYLTLFAFSTENWKRPASEVSLLMDLFRRYLSEDVKKMQENNLCVHFIGDKSRFDADIQEKMKQIEQASTGNEENHLCLALSYSGRDELIRAVKRMKPEDIGNLTEESFSCFLDTAGIPEPDLLIRTSGEQRISNFLLWQLAYTELFFTPVHWPDFGEKELDEAINAYNSRDRRFGKV